MYKEFNHILGITLFFIAIDATANTILYFYEYKTISIATHNDENLSFTLFNHSNLIKHNGLLNKNMVAVIALNNDKALISQVLTQCEKDKSLDTNICIMFKNVI